MGNNCWFLLHLHGCAHFYLPVLANEIVHCKRQRVQGPCLKMCKFQTANDCKQDSKLVETYTLFSCLNKLVVQRSSCQQMHGSALLLLLCRLSVWDQAKPRNQVLLGTNCCLLSVMEASDDFGALLDGSDGLEFSGLPVTVKDSLVLKPIKEDSTPAAGTRGAKSTVSHSPGRRSDQDGAGAPSTAGRSSGSGRSKASKAADPVGVKPCKVCGRTYEDMPPRTCYCWPHKRTVDVMVLNFKKGDVKHGTKNAAAFNKMRDASGPPPSEFSEAVMSYEAQHPAEGKGYKRGQPESVLMIEEKTAWLSIVSGMTASHLFICLLILK